MSRIAKSLLVAAGVLATPYAQAATIAETAAATDSLSTLVSALTAAGVVDEFTKTDTTYTVFAPTNDAFVALSEALGATSVDDLLALPTLSRILQYHVLPNVVNAGDITDGAEAETLLSPQTLSFTVADGAVAVNGNTNVATADIACDGGVVHVVDGVLVPGTIVDVASSNSDFSTLVTALSSAIGLVDLLSGLGQEFTVFAPTNDAFTAALSDLGMTVEDLLADPATLTDILSYHVVEGALMSDGVEAGEVETANGENFMVKVEGDAIYLEGTTTAQITGVDINALNGVIHVIDYVLIPQTVAEAMAAAAEDDTPAEDDSFGHTPAEDDSTDSSAVSPVFAALTAMIAA